MPPGRRRPLFEEILGTVKDKVSLGKAAILSKPHISMAVLRATTHEPCSPAPEKHISALLSFGRSSRLTAASCISALMDRLSTTHSPSVALKCLLAVHNILRRGAFILQDQISIHPPAGGRNYLNLSSFHDASTPASWQLSSCVRWYARALEQILITSRLVGFFLSFPSSDQRLTTLSNRDLLKEVDSLVGVVEEIAKAPAADAAEGNQLVAEVMRLVGEDNLMTQKEILIRLMEMRERLNCMTMSESVELACMVERLKNCKRPAMFVTLDEKLKSGEGLLSELAGAVEEKMVSVGEGFAGRIEGVTGRKGWSESARFADRVVAQSVESIGFHSGRWRGS